MVAACVRGRRAPQRRRLERGLRKGRRSLHNDVSDIDLSSPPPSTSTGERAHCESPPPPRSQLTAMNNGQTIHRNPEGTKGRYLGEVVREGALHGKETAAHIESQAAVILPLPLASRCMRGATPRRRHALLKKRFARLPLLSSPYSF